MMENMPSDYREIEKTRGTKGYPKRFTANPQDDFWKGIYSDLMGGAFKKYLLHKFNIPDGDYKEDILLVRDMPGYAIPPHTDSLNKVITVLIYLPENNDHEEEGTTIYTPKEKGFTCNKGRHYSFEQFDVYKTMPFRANSMFAFARTDNSFHGVAPCAHIRNVLLYNILRNGK